MKPITEEQLASFSDTTAYSQSSIADTSFPCKQKIHTPMNHKESEENDVESLTVYYQVFNRHRPEMGESNAESVHRMNIIDDEVREVLAKRRKTLVTNNVQEYELHTSHSLYENQDKRLVTTQIEVIYDTGAALSMISGEPEWA
jgi:hypothetical protein